MSKNNSFGPGGPFNDPFKRQREQAELIKRALGPTHELQQQIKAMEGPLATIRDLQRTGVFAHLAALQDNGVLGTARANIAAQSESIAAMKSLTSPAWMRALQTTAIGIDERDLGILKTQRLLAASTGPDVLKLAKSFETNPSVAATMMAASKWSGQFRALRTQFAPSLAGIKIAAERARMLDVLTLRASAEIVAKSAALIAAEQVLEAHRLIEAIGQADSPEQSVNLFAALLSVMGAIFSRFGENTVKELQGIGAFRLLEIVLMAIALFHMIVPDDIPPAQQKVVAEFKAEIETLEDKLDKIIAANEAANTSYVTDLPRAELKRNAAIRRAPQGTSGVLMRGTQGMTLAVKGSQGKWRLVVYRDQLTNQLAEGWVYAPAVQLLDTPAP